MPVVVKAKSWASSGTAFLVTVIVASFVFVYVQVTTSPGTSAMLAMPVAMLVVPLEQTSAVSAQPGTAVSSIVLVPVASAPVKVNVTVFNWRINRRRRRAKPAPKSARPVPVVVKAKSWASSGTAFLVTVIVAESLVFVYVQVTTSPGTSAMLAMPVAMLRALGADERGERPAARRSRRSSWCRSRQRP